MYNIAREVIGLGNNAEFYSIETRIDDRRKIMTLLPPHKDIGIRFIEVSPRKPLRLLPKLQITIEDVMIYNRLSLSQLYVRLASSKLSFLPPDILIRFFRSLKTYDIIHISALESPLTYPLTIRPAKQLGRSKTVCHFLYHPVPCFSIQRYSLVRLKAIKDLARNFDAITCSTPFEALMLKQLDLKNAYFIGEGIDLEYIAKCYNPSMEKTLADQLSIPKQAAVVLFIGARSKSKGYYDSLIAIHKLITVENRRIFFIAIGRPDYFDNSFEGQKIKQIEQILTKNKNMLLFDFITEETKFAFINLSDMILIPSLYETVPLVALEAWAFKKPIIVANIPTVKSVTGDDSAVVVDFGNILQIQKAIVNLATKPDFARRLGYTGYKKVIEVYNLKEIANKLNNVYNEIINR